MMINPEGVVWIEVRMFGDDLLHLDAVACLGSLTTMSDYVREHLAERQWRIPHDGEWHQFPAGWRFNADSFDPQTGISDAVIFQPLS